MLCPHCRQEIFFAEYCSKCGQKIAARCPVCDNLHLIGTLFCPVTGQDFQRYIEYIEKILVLIDGFPHSKEEAKFNKERQNDIKLAKILGTTCFIYFLIAGIYNYFEHTAWPFWILGGISLFLFLPVMATSDDYQTRLDRYLKNNGIKSEYFLRQICYRNFSVLREKINQSKILLNQQPPADDDFRKLLDYTNL